LRQIRDSGIQHSRTSHHHDVTRHEARDQRSERLSEPPTNLVANDGAPDTTAYSKTDAW
jgi:hypothetical protein